GDALVVAVEVDQLLARAGADEVAARPDVRRRVAEGDDRVGEDREVRPATGALDRVGGVGLAGVEVRRRGRGEVAAGGEAPDADALRIDVVFPGLRPDVSNRPLHVEHRRRV